MRSQPILLSNWLYAAACVVVPVAWGVLMVRVSNRIERLFRWKKRSQETDGESPPLEYHI